jgi:cytochrome P450
MTVELPGGDYDPFEFLDRSTGGDTVRDPYPEWALLRNEAGIHHVATTESPLPIVAAESPSEAEPGYYAAVSYDAVSEVLKDGERFSSAGYADFLRPVMGRTILEMDEPEHRSYRGLVAQAFTRTAVEGWIDALVEPIIRQHIARFAADGKADLVKHLAFSFPVQVIAGMLGLPDRDWRDFHRWAVELISAAYDWDRAVAASAALEDFFAPLVTHRRVELSDGAGVARTDLLSALVRAELDGERLGDAEIFAFLRLLLPAGAETTSRVFSSLLFGLLTNPDQLHAVRADRSLVPQAIEEALRWEPPLTAIMRTATVDTVVTGVPVPAGAIISVIVGAANRDEARWPNADQFDIFRDQKPHIAFASGPHTCLGIHLGRMEMVVALNLVLDLLAGLALDPDADDVHISGAEFRSAKSLPVVFDPR